jgi:hypothetical protein
MWRPRQYLSIMPPFEGARFMAYPARIGFMLGG